MAIPVNIGKRGLVQALTPTFLLPALFCAAAAWEETPFGPLSTTTATLEVMSKRGRTTGSMFLFDEHRGHCAANLCFRRGLEARGGETFTVERDSRGVVFSVSDQRGQIVSPEAVQQAFLRHLAWGSAWLSLFGLGVARLLSRRRFSDE